MNLDQNHGISLYHKPYLYEEEISNVSPQKEYGLDRNNSLFLSVTMVWTGNKLWTFPSSDLQLVLITFDQNHGTPSDHKQSLGELFSLSNVST